PGTPADRGAAGQPRVLGLAGAGRQRLAERPQAVAPARFRPAGVTRAWAAGHRAWLLRSSASSLATSRTTAAALATKSQVILDSGPEMEMAIIAGPRTTGTARQRTATSCSPSSMA